MRKTKKKNINYLIDARQKLKFDSILKNLSLFLSQLSKIGQRNERKVKTFIYKTIRFRWKSLKNAVRRDEKFVSQSTNWNKAWIGCYRDGIDLVVSTHFCCLMNCASISFTFSSLTIIIILCYLQTHGGNEEKKKSYWWARNRALRIWFTRFYDDF